MVLDSEDGFRRILQSQKTDTAFTQGILAYSNGCKDMMMKKKEYMDMQHMIHEMAGTNFHENGLSSLSHCGNQK